MKIFKIEVERFLGIKKVIFEVDKDLQVVAGANNSGKTTLMKSLDYFFSLNSENLEVSSFAPKNHYYKSGGVRSLTRIKLFFSDLTSNEKTKFKEALLSSGHFWAEVKISKAGKVEFKASNNKGSFNFHRKIQSCYQVYHIPVLRVGVSGISSGETQRLHATVRDALVKKRPGPKSKLQKRYTKAFKTVDNLVKNVLKNSETYASKMLPNESDIKFDLPKEEEVLLSILQGLRMSSRSKLNLNIEEEGTGFQSLLSLGLLEYALKDIKSYSSQNVLFLIEEPEAFLHPHYQRYVARYVKELATDSQVFLTTHSPVIIDSLEISKVAKLKKNSKGLEWSWKKAKLEESDEGRLSRFCDAKNSELIFSKKIIFCEGITDVGVIRELLEKGVEVDYYLDNVSIIDMQSKDNSPHFIELAERFEIPYIIIFDSDVYLGDTSSLRKALKKMMKPVTDEINTMISSLKQNPVTSFKESVERSEKVNSKFSGRNIFFLSGDIEYAVATSFSKEHIIDVLSEIPVQHFSAESRKELSELSGEKYLERLRSLIGSKGWNNSKPVKDNKPKPYLLSHIIRNKPGNFVGNSDISKLVKKLKEFIA